MDRREILAGAGILGAVMMSGLPALADDGAKSISKEKLQKITDTTFDCLKKGEACYGHCLEMLKKGDTSMKECHSTLSNMMAACTAMSKISSYDSAKPDAIRKLAAVCASLCRDCSDSCKVHAEHHAVCKTCMEACNKCASACDDIA